MYFATQAKYDTDIGDFLNDSNQSQKMKKYYNTWESVKSITTTHDDYSTQGTQSSNGGESYSYFYFTLSSGSKNINNNNNNNNIFTERCFKTFNIHNEITSNNINNKNYLIFVQLVVLMVIIVKLKVY